MQIGVIGRGKYALAVCALFKQHRVILFTTETTYVNYSSCIHSVVLLARPERQIDTFVDTIANHVCDFYIPVGYEIYYLLERAQRFPTYKLFAVDNYATLKQLDNKTLFATMCARLHVSIPTFNQPIRDKAIQKPNYSFGGLENKILVEGSCCEMDAGHPNCINSTTCANGIIQEFIEGRDFSCFGIAVTVL